MKCERSRPRIYITVALDRSSSAAAVVERRAALAVISSLKRQKPIEHDGHIYEKASTDISLGTQPGECAQRVATVKYFWFNVCF